MKTRIYMILLLGLIVLLPLTAQNSYTIIVNKSAQNETLTRSNLENIFLGKKSRWSDGTKIKPVNLKEGETYRAFIKEVVRKSTNAYMNYWRKMIFTGKGVMPVSFQDEEELINYVGRTEGAIGYISSADMINGNDDVQILTLSD